MMGVRWADGIPIYRQLRDRIVDMILDGTLAEGDALPSVRQLSADYQLNPITVSRAFQELAQEELVDKRRGLGMFVAAGARARLLELERQRFLGEEWPPILRRIQRLGLDPARLLGPLADT